MTVSSAGTAWMWSPPSKQTGMAAMSAPYHLPISRRENSETVTDEFGAFAQPRDHQFVGGAEARREIIRQRPHRRVMHHDDLMAGGERPEHAEIEQKLAGAMQRIFDLLPGIAGEKADPAQRYIFEREIARRARRKDFDAALERRKIASSSGRSP